MKKELIKHLWELLFPTRCLGCEEILYQKDRDDGFCPECLKKVQWVSGSFCVKCGKQMKETTQEFCKDCKKKKHIFIENRALFVYRQPMKEAMYRFKYGNRRSYATYFGREFAKKYGKWIAEKDIEAIVPVPMYRRKERRRGYNQATLLAEALGREMGLPVEKDWVIRWKNSKPQKNLDDEERKNNLKNAFKIRKSGVKLKKILLIDDIYTTGTTMDEVAKTLISDGVEAVYCLSVCIGEGDSSNT